MNSKSNVPFYENPEDPVANFNFADWIQKLIKRGQEQGFVQIDEISFPIPNGARLSNAKIEEIVERLNSEGIYVSQDISPIMPSMGLIRMNSDDCLVSLSYKCSLKWDDLEVTDNPDVRHCIECKKNVYHIKAGSDISIAIENGACVAFFK